MSVLFTRDDLIKEMRSHIGTPFVAQGRLKGKGEDCAGFAINVYKEFGLTIKDKTNYGYKPNQNDILNSLYECDFVDIPFSHAKPGDILLMDYENNLQHIAMVSQINPIYIIHAVMFKKVIEHRLDSVWKNRVARVFTYKKLLEEENK